jgi:hypothetical protein
MWGILSHSSLATVVLDYTNTLSFLGGGLFGLVALSGGMIVFTAMRHSLSQRGKPMTETAPSPESYDTAA